MLIAKGELQKGLISKLYKSLQHESNINNKETKEKW